MPNLFGLSLPGAKGRKKQLPGFGLLNRPGGSPTAGFGPNQQGQLPRGQPFFPALNPQQGMMGGTNPLPPPGGPGSGFLARYGGAQNIGNLGQNLGLQNPGNQIGANPGGGNASPQFQVPGVPPLPSLPGIANDPTNQSADSQLAGLTNVGNASETIAGPAEIASASNGNNGKESNAPDPNDPSTWDDTFDGKGKGKGKDKDNTGLDLNGVQLIQPGKETLSTFHQHDAYVIAGGKLDYRQWLSAVEGTATDPDVPGDAGQTDDFIEFLRSLGINLNTADNDVDPNSNQNRFEQGAGLFGGNLFGTGKLSDSYAGLIANILSGEIGRQGGRATEQEGLLRDLIMQGQGSAANRLNESALARAQQLTDPAALDSLREKLVNQARSTSAAGENASMNRLRDLGVVGQGGAATGAVNQASNLANQGLQRNLTDIDVGIEGIQRQRLQQAGQMAAQGGDTFRSLGQNPQLQLADRLGSAFNPATGSLTDFLGQMLNVHQGQALAASTGSNFFEGGGGQLLGGLIGGVGSALGGGGLEALLKKR